ncbi:S9 family peptidase [Actinomadura barringtoniae]|uniref:S9 family peptidase n=1 Tax=Actinomadura barringtoniae TaxID=1427535 RepID=A0A939PGB8_9ACTN|nr:S9 family peptidase [Actinomadura barringtoniae]MBO2448684.1 S9 family peptidase [Actinomadura barringtoniae]
MTLSYRDFVPTQRFQPRALAIAPDAGHVAYSSNQSGQFNLWVQPVTGGPARQLTRYVGCAVRNVAWSPDGRWLVYTADRDGDEQAQLYRVEAEGGEPEPIAQKEACQHALARFPFDTAGRRLVYSVNDRDPATPDIVVRDLVVGSEQRFVPPAGVVIEPIQISPDGRWLLGWGLISAVDTQAFLIDLAAPDAQPRQVGPTSGYFEPVVWAPDSTGFYVRTDTWDGEWIGAGFFDLGESTVLPLARVEGDLEHLAVADDLTIWSVNEGHSALYAQRNGTDIELPPPPDAVITDMRVSDGAELLVMQLDAAERPMEIAVLDLRRGDLRYLTDSRPEGLRMVQPVSPRTVTFPSQGGRTVAALQYEPHEQEQCPVLIWVHGGPHEQVRPDYGRFGMFQYLAAKGVLVICPNFAGSTGYGIAFQKLIYRNWGGPDLEDLQATLDYLRSLPGIDKARIATAGGSYGGFATLSCLARIDYPWAAGVSLCGPSDLVTLAAKCPPIWRSFVDTILGNPDRDADLLRSRSPITYADRIKAPLFVIQGATDPRVPQEESDQIVGKLRANGNEVRYDIYPDEGHGFTSRTNEIKAYSDIAEFLLAHLEPAAPK